MGDTSIPYATKSWQIGTGCDQAGGPGCVHCWAAHLASGRLSHLPFYRGIAKDGKWTGEIRVNGAALDEPFHWRKPQVVFVAPMTEFFLLPLATIAASSRVMAQCPQHTFLIVTHHARALDLYLTACGWSLPDNVYLLATCENQERADAMLPVALRSGAKVVANLEPMLGSVYLRRFIRPPLEGLILGGESGPNARPMHPDWVLGVLDQCQAAGVPFYFKQWGEWSPDNTSSDYIAQIGQDGWWDRGAGYCGFGRDHPGSVQMWRVGTRSAGHLLDGKQWRELPWSMRGDRAGWPRKEGDPGGNLKTAN